MPLFDPFLMLDDFYSANPPDYLKGFPWHPHRGIETITYVLHGRVEHGGRCYPAPAATRPVMQLRVFVLLR